MNTVLVIALAALAALNVLASFRCLRDTSSSRGQRAAQVAFIWLVPLPGAALALHLTRREPQRGAGRYAEPCGMGEAGWIGNDGDGHGSISSSDGGFEASASCDSAGGCHSA